MLVEFTSKMHKPIRETKAIEILSLSFGAYMSTGCQKSKLKSSGRWDGIRLSADLLPFAAEHPTPQPFQQRGGMGEKGSALDCVEDGHAVVPLLSLKSQCEEHAHLL